MLYIQVETELIHHPKLKKLARLLNLPKVHAAGHLIALWTWAAQYAEDGDLTRYLDEPQTLADAAEWPGDPQAFLDALIGSGYGAKPGFIEVSPNGDATLHDWHEYFGKVFDRRAEDAERKRRKLEDPNGTQSPIEDALWLALVDRSKTQDLPLPALQLHVGNYWLDFAWIDQRLAVELDGHDYHKTKAQRTHDAKRDRELLKLGWRTIRFTGSDVYTDVNSVVEDIAVFLHLTATED